MGGRLGFWQSDGGFPLRIHVGAGIWKCLSTGQSSFDLSYVVDEVMHLRKF